MRWLCSAFFVLPAFFGHAQEFVVDSAHSSIVFDVDHLGVLTVTGRFLKFSGRLNAAERESSLEGMINVASITTDNSYRDEILKSEPYLAAVRYPNITFKGTDTPGSTTETVTGILTIHGKSKSLRWEMLRETRGGKLHLHGKLVIRRKEFNLDFGPMNDMIGDEVYVTVDFLFRPADR